jgi:hypothetical protein
MGERADISKDPFEGASIGETKHLEPNFPGKKRIESAKNPEQLLSKEAAGSVGSKSIAERRVELERWRGLEFDSNRTLKEVDFYNGALKYIENIEKDIDEPGSAEAENFRKFAENLGNLLKKLRGYVIAPIRTSKSPMILSRKRSVTSPQKGRKLD